MIVTYGTYTAIMHETLTGVSTCCYVEHTIQLFIYSIQNIFQHWGLLDFKGTAEQNSLGIFDDHTGLVI